MLASSHNIFEVIGDDLLFVVVVGYPPIVVFKAVNVILPPPPINLPIEEFGIGVALPYVGYPRALPLTSPLNNRKAHNFPLKVGSQSPFLMRKRPRLLCQIQAKDDNKGGMVQHLVGG
jgi:hypothetical protein